MEKRCHACGLDILDNFYWKVKGVNGVENWCAECHSEEREGIRDALVWRDEEGECDGDHNQQT